MLERQCRSSAGWSGDEEDSAALCALLADKVGLNELKGAEAIIQERLVQPGQSARTKVAVLKSLQALQAASNDLVKLLRKKYFAHELFALVELEQVVQRDDVHGYHLVWAKQRLGGILEDEEPLHLLESLVSILRGKVASQPSKEVIDRSKQLLSRTIRRPGGAHSLLLCIYHSVGGDTGGVGAAQAVRLLSSVPKSAHVDEYMRDVCPQFLLLLDPAAELDPNSDPTARAMKRLPLEEEAFVQFVRACGARLVGTMHTLYPSQSEEYLINPLVASFINQEIHTFAFDLAVARLHSLVCAAPPNGPLCDSLLKSNVLLPLLRKLCAPQPIADAKKSEPFQIRRFERARSDMLESVRQLLCCASTPVTFLEEYIVATTIEIQPLTDTVVEILSSDRCSRIQAALVDKMLSRCLSILECARNSEHDKTAELNHDKTVESNHDKTAESNHDKAAELNVSLRLWECMPKLLSSATPSNLGPLLESDSLLSLLVKFIGGGVYGTDSDDDDDDGEGQPPQSACGLADADLIDSGLRVVELVLDIAAQNRSLASALARELLEPLRKASLCPVRSVAERATSVAVSIMCLQKATWVSADTVEGNTFSQRDDRESDFDRLRCAMAEVVSNQAPLRAHAIDTARRLIEARSDAALEHFMPLVALFIRQVDHPDSFVFQSAFNALTAAAELRPRDVFPRLASILRPAKSGLGLGRGRGVLGDERRLKAAQAVCQAVKRLGSAVPPHAPEIMHALLVGIRDDNAAVRASCLACLAFVCETLAFAVHPWVVELLDCIEATLVSERDSQARQAATYLLARLLRELEKDALLILNVKQLRRLYILLRGVRDSKVEEPLVREHAQGAIAQLDSIGESLLRPSLQMGNAEIFDFCSIYKAI